MLRLLVNQGTQNLKNFTKNLSGFCPSNLKQIAVLNFVKNWEQIFEATYANKHITRALAVDSA
jgi:hypothetical protein